MSLDGIVATAVFAGAMGVVALVGRAHEKRAQAREARAIERHEKEMKALIDNNAMTLAAVHQRSRLETQMKWVLQALENHAEHLERMGAEDVLKHIPQELLK